MNNAELRDNLRNTYDKYAQQRETHTMPDWKIELRSKFLSLLQKEQKKTLLEIGAGTGRDSKFLQEQGMDVVCIDLSPAMTALCKQKGLTAYLMDMADIRLPASSFDAVYSMNSLLHLPKAEFPVVLRGIDVLLKTDGVVFIGMYGGREHEGIWDNDSYEPKRFFSFFTDEHLQEEVKKVFDIISFESIRPEPDDDLGFQSLILRKKYSPRSSQASPLDYALHGPSLLFRNSSIVQRKFGAGIATAGRRSQLPQWQTWFVYPTPQLQNLQAVRQTDRYPN